MRLSRVSRTGLAALAACAAVGLTTVSPAYAADDCRLTVKNVDSQVGDEVQALELNEKNGDEIFLRLNGQRFPSSGVVTFTLPGQGRPTSAFDNPHKDFSGAIQVELIEKDFLGIGNDTIGNVFLPCQPLGATLQLINGGPGAYNVEIEIKLI